MTREEVIDLAREHAAAAPEGTLPFRFDVQTFIPHDWVIALVQAAYARGREDEKEENFWADYRTDPGDSSYECDP